MDVLNDDIGLMLQAWDPNATNNYAQAFKTLPSTEALSRILIGIGFLTKGEWHNERLLAPYDNQDQEDEHSCFSDNTLNDFKANQLGIENVYFGRFGTLDGPGLEDLVRAVDQDLDQEMQGRLVATRQALEGIPSPFDQAILGEDSSPGRVAITRLLAALRDQASTIGTIATRLNLRIAVE